MDVVFITAETTLIWEVSHYPPHLPIVSAVTNTTFLLLVYVTYPCSLARVADTADQPYGAPRLQEQRRMKSQFFLRMVEISFSGNHLPDT